MILRKYQIDIASDACRLLEKYKIAYLAMECRCGKTLTSLQAAKNYGAKKVIFFTKKKAIGSIESDYRELAPDFKLFVTNYEQLPNFQKEGFDLVICDEAHSLSQFPLMSKRAELLKIICAGLPIIYLSGSPTPESFSQIFHQLHISSFSPFAQYKNFYAWVNAGYVTKKTKYIFNRELTDYSYANQEKIEREIKHLFLSYTQKESGFTQFVQETVLKVEMKNSTYLLANKIKNTRVHIGKDGQEIIADTEVKLMQKLHQIYSGTVISETGDAICFDDSKAHFIKHYFKGKKIAIFYKFKAEFTMLLKTFGNSITLSPEEFEASQDKIFCSQVQSGREGINLSTADALVMYNIDFSHVSYIQAQARFQAKNRTKECLLYWIFSDNGIEERIYERVKAKKDYVLYYFKKDFKIKSNARTMETR